MGTLMAARLSSAMQAGGSGVEAERPERVILYGRPSEHIDAIQRDGVTLTELDGSAHSVPVTATSDPADVEGSELVIVLVKSWATGDSVKPLKEHLTRDAVVLTLQNGLGNVDALCGMVGSARVLAGATSEAATLLEPGKARHAAAGLTVFGSWTSCPTDTAFTAFQDAGFDVRITDTPGQVVWEKAVINAGINPLTALLNVPNGRLLETAETRELLRDLVMEATKVASTEGYRFTRSLAEAAEALCRATSENLSSMLQDIRSGRRTEIEALSADGAFGQV